VQFPRCNIDKGVLFEIPTLVEPSNTV
jgi:hypothetical protein